MSKDDEHCGGFVPLGDMAGAVELPNGRALTPAAPQALHHFTRLDQIDQLIGASDCGTRHRLHGAASSRCAVYRAPIQGTGKSTSGATGHTP